MLKHSHSSWLQTVPSNPEAILFKFVPISSLLAGIPGSGYLSHAINLYLRCRFFSDLKVIHDLLHLLISSLFLLLPRHFLPCCI